MFRSPFAFAKLTARLTILGVLIFGLVLFKPVTVHAQSCLEECFTNFQLCLVPCFNDTNCRNACLHTYQLCKESCG